MPKFIISTQSYRHEYDTGIEQPTQFGYLVETDFSGSRRLLRIPTPTHSPFNERIKTGLRGLGIWGRYIYVASWNRIHRVDRVEFKYVDSFSHELMADLHGIYVDSDAIWVTSSLIDALLKFNHKFELLEVLTLTDSIVYPAKLREPIDLSKDYRLRGKEWSGFRHFHANHITALNDHALLLTGRGKGNKDGRVLQVDRKSMDFKIWARGLKGPHDGLFVTEKLFATTETNGSSIALLLTKGLFAPRIVKRIHLPRTEERFWTRGLAWFGDRLYIGRSVWKGDDRYASVVVMDLEGNLLGEHELDILDYPECRIFQIIPA